MQLVFYSIVLNHHQAPVADEFYKILGNEYCFVELVNREGHNKGSLTDYSSRPYLIRSWESEKAYAKAMELAKTADVCVFSGIQSLPFMKERMKRGLLSFDMSERWLKQGLKNILSPALSKQFIAYWFGGWWKKPLYKLCMSAYAAGDHYRLGMYKGKCFKWGYFTQVDQFEPFALGSAAFIASAEKEPFEQSKHIVRLLWVGRFIGWKHPEVAVELCKKLTDNGCLLMLDMYGDGPLRKSLEAMISSLGLSDVVKLHGNVPNEEVRTAMRNSDIFVFTSNRQEGWGAVLNEAMAQGCCSISSIETGSTPYLIKNGINGLSFSLEKEDDLYNKVVWAIDHPEEHKKMGTEAYKTMQEVWSPKSAVNSFLHLIDDINNNKTTSNEDGPCSYA